MGAAHDNDTIIVYNGSYNESITMYKRLILKGEGHPVVGGIRISTDGCVIDGFSVTGSNSGIRVRSDYNRIVNNSIYNNEDDGIELEGSDYNTITSNLVFNNSDDGIDIDYSFNNIIINNTVEKSENNGIALDDSGYNTIANNSVFNNSNGIALDHSFNNMLINNTANSNADNGLYLGDLSNKNTIANNNFSLNNDAGIYMGDSFYNELFNNIVSSSSTGIGIGNSDYNEITNNTVLLCNPNINLENSSYNNITNNIIYSSHCNGILLENSSNNGILNNIIYHNYNSGYYGICLESSTYNEIYHNDLINSTNPAYDDGTTNSWDNGPIIGGNYWNEHECTGDPSDGSQPYCIDADSIDLYPFEHPINDVSSIPPPEPVAYLIVTKRECISTNETHIEHDKDYEFEVDSWLLQVTGIHDMRTDNMTYTITTPMNFTYLGNGEESENGTWNHILRNFTQVGQNYTWILPLKDRISSEIRLKLPTETTRHKPCIDMDVNKIAENNHTRINITFVPLTFGCWGCNLYVEGGHIINVTTYPSDLSLHEGEGCVEFGGEINKNQTYNFSVLLDDPLSVRAHFVQVGEYEWACDYSNNVTQPVEGLGHVTLTSDGPVGWAYELPFPEYDQIITIELNK
jgi:parallel beta-helix repeat protein